MHLQEARDRMTRDEAMERGLPASLDTERFVLGSILLNDSSFPTVLEVIQADDFALEKHRRIFARMKDLYDIGVRIDRVTLADELIKHGQLESVDGLAYLVSLDDGLPETSNLGAYLQIIRDKSTLRKIIFAAQRAINRALVLEDADDIRSGLESQLAGLEAEDDSISRISDIVEAEGGANQIVSPRAHLAIQTPWPDANKLMEGGGIPKGQLTVIAARPSMGKTSIGAQIAMRAAQDKHNGIFDTLEMSKAQLTRRMACARAQVDSLKMSHGTLDANERRRIAEAMAWLIEAPIWVTNKYRTAAGLRTAARAFRAKRPLDYIVVDYIGLMKHTGDSRIRRHEQIGEIARELKLLAEEIDVAMVVLCQLNRDSAKEKGEPELHHMRDSGAIEEHADVVIMPHRLPDQDKLATFVKCKWFFRKQRNAPTGEIDLVFQKTFTCYMEDFAREEPEQQSNFF